MIVIMTSFYSGLFFEWGKAGLLGITGSGIQREIPLTLTTAISVICDHDPVWIYSKKKTKNKNRKHSRHLIKPWRLSSIQTNQTSPLLSFINVSIVMKHVNEADSHFDFVLFGVKKFYFLKCDLTIDPAPSAQSFQETFLSTNIEIYRPTLKWD